MKKIILLFGVFLSLLFCSCVTTKMDTYGVPKKTTADFYSELDSKIYTAEDNNLKVEAVSFAAGEWIRLSFSNKSDKSIIIISDLVQFFGRSKEYTSRLLPEETRRVLAASSIPNFMIPSGEKIEKNYTVKDDYYHFIYESSISYIAISYKVDSEEKYLKVPNTNYVDQTKFEGTKVGSVQSKWIFIHPLFIQLSDLNRETLYKRAMEKAEDKYGEDVYLANLNFEGSWNPLSLIFYFDAFGFVENGELTADVYKK